MADDVERNLDNVNRQIKEIISSLKALKQESVNAGKTMSTSLTPQNQKQVIQQIDAKRKTLFDEQNKLRSQATHQISGTDISTSYPPGVEARINKISEAIGRLNAAFLNIRKMKS